MLILTPYCYYTTRKIINIERLLAMESQFSPIFLMNSDFFKKKHELILNYCKLETNHFGGNLCIVHDERHM